MEEADRPDEREAEEAEEADASDQRGGCRCILLCIFIFVFPLPFPPWRSGPMDGGVGRNLASPVKLLLPLSPAHSVHQATARAHGDGTTSNDNALLVTATRQREPKAPEPREARGERREGSAG
ncbi:hypothetical protein B2J93_6702 [Marssonina coronariae]|uniref:Uncharacterized protein n=1 Tax=Diplocarpon coronariae TaxID=2795749 RepID=A0A218ZH96_9HELO|nr:hypothetical protein B2J93_6702 [Marssonina coronariae]